jgi:HK97 family phage portal protein
MSSKSRRRRAALAKAKAEERSISVDGTGSFTGAFTLPTIAGAVVTEQTALSIAAVWRAVHIYADTIAKMGLKVYEASEGGGSLPAPEHPNDRLLAIRPNRVNTAFRFWQTIVGHARTRGNGYAEIERGPDRMPVALHLLDPRNVDPQPTEDKKGIVYRLIKEGKDLPARDVVHIAGMGFDGIKGYSPVTFGREMLGATISQETYQSGLMGNSASAGGFLEIQGNPKQDAIDRLLDNFNKRHQGSERAGNTGALTHGAKWVQTSFSPADAELILQRGFSVAEVARFWGLPVHMLGGPVEAGTLGSLEEQNRQFYELSLMPWLESIEQELNIKLFPSREWGYYFVKFDVRSLLRGNVQAQTQENKEYFSVGVFTQNDILRSLGMNPIGELGDKHYIPTNNLTAIEDIRPAGPKVGTDPALPEIPHAGETDPAATEVTDVQATAMNGAQIASLLQIITAVTAGTLPADSAKGLIGASFPVLTTDQVDAILTPLATFKPAGETPAAPPPTTEPPPTAGLATDLRDALRSILADPIGRMIRRECKAARSASKRGETFLEWIDSYYVPHVGLVTESIAPAIRAITATLGHGLDAATIAGRIVEESRERLHGLVVCVPPDELPDAVDRVCLEWEADRAASLAGELIDA